MKVAIRADASASIGTGHIRRMLSLAKALRSDGGEVIFLSRQLGVDASGMIARKGFAEIRLPVPVATAKPDPLIPHSAWSVVDQEQDIDDTCAALFGMAIECIVVDHYAFDARWHDAVAQRLNIPVMVIDDLADRPLGGRWVVDHNYHPAHDKKFGDRIAETATLLAGPRFAMIDPDYATAPRYTFNNDVRSIGIFMGGIDLGDDTSLVLDVLDEIAWDGGVEAVVTSHNSARERIAKRLATRSEATLSQDLPDLAGFFARHDLQIGAGGGAIWERCCIGPPTIAMVCADNQTMSIPYADAAGFLRGVVETESPAHRRSALAEAIVDLLESPLNRAALSRMAMQVVDGRGTARISAALMGKD